MMNIAIDGRSLRRALLASTILPTVLMAAAPVNAQSDQAAYDRQYEQPATKRTRAKRTDAYRAPDDGAGLGTLSSSGAPSDNGPYAAPADVAQGYGTSPPPPYASGGASGGNAYPSAPANYPSAPPPYASGPAPYGNSAPASRPYPANAGPANDAYRPPGGGAYGQPPSGPPAGYGGPSPAYDGRAASNQSGSFGQPYSPPPQDEFEARDSGARRPYMSGEDHRRPPYRDERGDGTFSSSEILSAGHSFFGSLSQGLASVIEYAFQRQGRPNGYILGEDIGGAFVAGLRYGEGRLHTKDAGSHKVYWQGPSLGYDVGAEGSKVMVLVYNLRDPGEIYERFGGVAGSAYVIGGVGLNFQSRDHLVLAPIRTGIGLRLGANVGYLKYTRQPTWNPF